MTPVYANYKKSTKIWVTFFHSFFRKKAQLRRVISVTALTHVDFVVIVSVYGLDLANVGWIGCF